MNGYELSRIWFDFCFENPEKIKPNHTALYFFAIEHCNRLGWKQKFGFPSTMVMEAIGIKSYNTYIKTLNDLVDFGFILMIERSKNQYSANIIALSKFNKALDKALDKAFIKHTSKQSESTSESIDSIDKQVNNKQLTIEQRNKPKNSTEFSEEVRICFRNCIDFFPDHYKPNTKKKTENWMKTIDKLNRLDKIPFEAIEQITKWARSNDFWAKNFQSLVKLRQKNKQDVYYIQVFNDQMNAKNGISSEENEQEINRRILEKHLNG